MKRGRNPIRGLQEALGPTQRGPGPSGPQKERGPRWSLGPQGPKKIGPQKGPGPRKSGAPTWGPWGPWGPTPHADSRKKQKSSNILHDLLPKNIAWPFAIYPYLVYVASMAPQSKHGVWEKLPPPIKNRAKSCTSISVSSNCQSFQNN